MIGNMVYVSEKPLKKEVLARISELLIIHIANIHTKSHSKQFLDEILTPAEKIKLAKRFAIIVMLYRKQSYLNIMKTLKVSQTTVAKINTELKRGEFDFIISQLTKKSSKTSSKSHLLFALDVMFGGGITSMGKNRWKFMDDIENKKKKLKRGMYK